MPQSQILLCTRVDMYCENKMFQPGRHYKFLGDRDSPAIVVLDDRNYERVVTTDNMRFLVRNSADPLRGKYASKEYPTGFAYFEFVDHEGLSDE